MVTRTLVQTAVLGAASLLLSGCATSRYSQSRIATAPQAAHGRGGHAVSFEIDGVKTRVESLDRVRQGGAAPRLSVRIAFEPRALGSSFDSGQVVLRLLDGRESRPLSSGYRALGPHSSVELVFDSAVESSESAELILAGLARGATRLEPVTLRLTRHEGTSIDRMYWLEAIGVALAAPLAGAAYAH
jgi:hypothetical protein